MNHSIKLCFLLTTAALCYSFSFEPLTVVFRCDLNYIDTSSRPPVFIDGGKSVDSLKRAYHCTTIEFENWEDDDATDSSLTVLLINTSIKGSISLDENHQLLKSVAGQIKKSLAYPQIYKSYYIIFITEQGEGFLKSRSHTLGGEIPGNIL